MKNKFSPRTLLLNKANKILKRHYANILDGSDLTENEIIAPTKEENIKICQICGLPILSKEDKENCTRLHKLESNEIIKED